MKIEGIPEGIEFVRWGVPSAGEFKFTPRGDLLIVSKGDCSPSDKDQYFIVRPADGYRFVPSGESSWRYRAVKTFEAHTVMIKATVSDEWQYQQIMDFLVVAKDFTQRL